MAYMLCIFAGIVLGAIAGRIDWHRDPLPVVEVTLPTARQVRSWRKERERANPLLGRLP